MTDSERSAMAAFTAAPAFTAYLQAVLVATRHTPGDRKICVEFGSWRGWIPLSELHGVMERLVFLDRGNQS